MAATGLPSRAGKERAWSETSPCQGRCRRPWPCAIPNQSGFDPLSQGGWTREHPAPGHADKRTRVHGCCSGRWSRRSPAPPLTKTTGKTRPLAARTQAAAQPPNQTHSQLLVLFSRHSASFKHARTLKQFLPQGWNTTTLPRGWPFTIRAGRRAACIELYAKRINFGRSNLADKHDAQIGLLIDERS